MKTVPAGKFKTHCLSLLAEVADTHKTLVVTKHGKPLAQVIPMVADSAPGENPLKGTVVFERDIVDPVEVEWEAKL
ncbi:MAG: type II toxin-antitoxin system Phd/YefM family antitoxin [Candidatus Latescibacteria bacterium]|nr:type II toxin-antitoxin system Phd/YefM family antitoxin [Candidatus Latescibacterota bacterium]